MRGIKIEDTGQQAVNCVSSLFIALPEVPTKLASNP